MAMPTAAGGGGGGGGKGRRAAEMRVAMEEMAKKLTLWHTRTFRPILTHDELEPIMSSVGFVPLPVGPPPQQPPAQPSSAVAWREYAFRAAARGGGWAPPRPRLPYPRVDGLHLMTYKAFFVALEFYLGPHLVPNLFHVRAMPLSRANDLAFDKAYRPMRDCGIEEDGIFVYREGTLDNFTKMVCYHSSSSDDSVSAMSTTTSNNGSEACYKKNSSNRGDGNNASNFISLVPLKDLFPSTCGTLVIRGSHLNL
ncbi:hypothetical protein ACMD2_10531 [Ananas comosus]|uniref:Uncharacterized protein n=1 Tax=Ananas comosus TaxID=4615 RepID=A0A199V0U1_ANACO|nr:hypothetical protein ACMD2_10531 [Ananas comosus]